MFAYVVTTMAGELIAGFSTYRQAFEFSEGRMCKIIDTADGRQCETGIVHL